MRFIGQFLVGLGLLVASASTTLAASRVVIDNVPDYNWYYGCFGTAMGNLIGFWDRNGMPNMYTGPLGDGLAPLDTSGANQEIVKMWASPGHLRDYWLGYQATDNDPYVTRGETEHTPDCVGDFIGLNQNKWADMNGECDGNIDGYSFNYWDARGVRRVNYSPPATPGLPPPRDLQSGLRGWSKYRGYEADVFTQLTDFNPATPLGTGFTFENLRAEIDAGYPVLVMLQRYGVYYREMPGMNRANPEIHGMMIYGYAIGGSGLKSAIYRTSWAVGESQSPWTSAIWQADMPVRGVIGYHPRPKVTRFERNAGQISIEWDGPASTVVTNTLTGEFRRPHWYVVEKSTSLKPAKFVAVAPATTDHSLTLSDPDDQTAFFRVRLEYH